MYCTSCGLPIPDGQGRSCSMCYGDVDYGRDGYYRDWVEQREQEQENRENADMVEEHIHQRRTI